LLASTWAMHTLLNANLWARRSHLMAANVEQEFFSSEDMNVLLPRSYYTEARTYRYRRVFRAALFLSLAFFIIALSSVPLERNPVSITIFVFSVLLLTSVYIEHRSCAREYAYLVAHAPGRPRNLE